MDLHTTKSANTDNSIERVDSFLIISGIVDESMNLLTLKVLVTQTKAAITSHDIDSPYHIEVTDNLDNIVYKVPVTLNFMDNHGNEGDVAFFNAILPKPDRYKTIRITENNTSLGEIERSDHIPVVEIITPVSGQTIGDEVEIYWEAKDDDHDTLMYDLLFSPDNGISWEVIALDLKDNSYIWNTGFTGGCDERLLRVLASDGMKTAEYTTKFNFVIPQNTNSYFRGRQILTDGFAYDVEDGNIVDSLKWYSDNDGYLGTGTENTLYNLSPGVHTISLTATDSDGNSVTKSVIINISDLSDYDSESVQIKRLIMWNPSII